MLMDTNERPNDPEIVAMAKVSAALSELKEEAVARVLRWAVERYGVKAVKTLGRTQGQTFVNITSDTEEASTAGEFQDFPTLFNAASPETDPERALVAGYWFQQVKGAEDLHGQQLNDELKHMGHGVGNITDALSSLIERRPAFVMQTRKTGTSRQARKRYRLTTEGIRSVQQMVAQGATTT